MSSCSPPSDTAGQYDVSYYDGMIDGSRHSARAVVPLVLELFPDLSSVVDFGCGPGAWLAEFAAAGVTRILGFDSGAGVGERLQIPAESFRAADLAGPIDDIGRHDLALSLETIEHLPADCGERLIARLCDAAPRILFSAALPEQRGQNHVNERWLSFWTEQFAARGFRPVDVLRPRIWRNEQIDWWYRQNLLLFLDGSIEIDPTRVHGTGDFTASDLVHPDCFIGHVNDLRRHAGQLARDVASLRAELGAIRAAAERSAADLADARARAAALEREQERWHGEARSESERVRRLLRAAEERCAQAQRLLGLRERECLRARQAEKRLRKSLSWRLTKPLRLLSRPEPRVAPAAEPAAEIEKPSRGSGWADHLVEQHVGGLSFADVGGLRTTSNEKVSVALRAGASHATMIDLQPLGGEVWERFDRRCQMLGVTAYDRLSGNLDDTAFVRRCGPFDFVHCAGLLHHLPNPRHSLRNLARLCRRHLLLVALTVPDVIANDQGEVVTKAGDGLYALELEPQQRRVLGRYFDQLGMEMAIIDPGDDQAWHEDGRVNYAPWWWLMTPRQVTGLLEQAGFAVLESGELSAGRSHGFWCRRTGG